MAELKVGMGFQKLAGEQEAVQFCGCIISDLLSHVMHKGIPGEIWITHQSHPNIAAVGLLKEFAAVIIAGGFKADKDTIVRAQENGLVLLATDLEAYDTAKIISSLELE